jgi:hypothetical protein
MQSWPYRIRHHWIVLLEPPGKWAWIVFAALLIVAVTGGWWASLPLIIVVALYFLFRYQEWRAEVIELDPRAVRHARGVRETSTSHAFLRIDRVSGVVLSQTVPGKIFGYGTVHLEAPGSHPDFRHLAKIQRPQETFEMIEALMFKTGVTPSGSSVPPSEPGSTVLPSEDDDPNDTGVDVRVTAPLPDLDPGRAPRRDG